MLQEELARLGLRIQPAKTRVVNLKRGEGFDFLGFHLRWVASRRQPGVHFWRDGHPGVPWPVPETGYENSPHAT